MQLTSQFMNQTVSKSASQPFIQLASQLINQTVSLSAYQPFSQLVYQLYIYHSTDVTNPFEVLSDSNITSNSSYSPRPRLPVASSSQGVTLTTKGFHLQLLTASLVLPKFKLSIS